MLPGISARLPVTFDWSVQWIQVKRGDPPRWPRSFHAVQSAAGETGGSWARSAFQRGHPEARPGEWACGGEKLQALILLECEIFPSTTWLYFCGNMELAESLRCNIAQWYSRCSCKFAGCLPKSRWRSFLRENELGVALSLSPRSLVPVSIREDLFFFFLIIIWDYKSSFEGEFSSLKKSLKTTDEKIDTYSF